MSYVSEKYQLGILVDHLEDEGFNYVREGMLYGIPIDIVGHKDSRLYMFECKTKDFKRGISQATRNLDFADRSYLVVWEDRMSDQLIRRVKTQGIGLISVDKEVSIIVEAPDNTPNEFARKEAKDLVI